MKKGQIYEGVVTKVNFPNKAEVQCEGERVIVKNALPGQVVKFSVNKVRKGKAEGRLLEVVKPADYEVETDCPHFGKCGGCSYRTMPYEMQLACKEKQLRDLLTEVIERFEQCPAGKNGTITGRSFDDIFEGVKASPTYLGYRNKMEFSFGDECKDGPLALGMHKRGSFHDIVSVTDCQIVDEDYRKILHCMLEYAKEKQLPFYHKMSHQGYLRHLLVRKTAKSGEILIDLITTTQMEVDSKEWAERLLSLDLDGTIAGILHTKNDSLADAVIDEGTEVVTGCDYITEELLGLQFKITPFSFFQTNSLGAEVLYDTAREYIGDTKDKKIYDLYSGTGTIAQILAPVASHVTGVEIVEEAVEAAKVNAELNKLDNCTFIAGDVLKVLDELPEKPDLIVIDPPRDGVNPKALRKIINYGVDRMVYISCKPSSLARDLEMLLGCGYRVDRCVGVDMFPATNHVETCVLLSRKTNQPKIEITMSLDEADMRENVGKATYQEIKDYVLEHHQTKVSSLYISQVKRKNGLEVGEAFNKPKNDDAKQPTCPKEKEKMIEEALKYFHMI